MAILVFYLFAGIDQKYSLMVLCFNNQLWVPLKTLFEQKRAEHAVYCVKPPRT